MVMVNRRKLQNAKILCDTSTTNQIILGLGRNSGNCNMREPTVNRKKEWVLDMMYIHAELILMSCSGGSN